MARLKTVWDAKRTVPFSVILPTDTMRFGERANFLLRLDGCNFVQATPANFCNFVRIWKGRDIRRFVKYLPEFDSDIPSYLLNSYLNRHIKRAVQLKLPIVYQSERSRMMNNLFIPESVSSKSITINNGTYINTKGVWKKFKKREHFQVVCTANWRPVKRLPLIIKAFELVIKHLPNAYLNIVGDIDAISSDYLESEVNSSLKEKLIFWGSIPNQELIGFYSQMDLGIFCGLHDPCPNAAIEMIAMGLPIVVNGTNGVAEIVHDLADFIVEENQTLKFCAYHGFDELDWEFSVRLSEKILHVLSDLEYANEQIWAIKDRVDIERIEAQYFQFWSENFA